MTAPATTAELANLVRRSGLVEPTQLDEFLDQPEIAGLPSDRPRKLARRLVRDGLLTSFQAEQFLRGRWRGFRLGRFRVLERLGSSELGQVFLCEDPQLHERVSVRVLPDLTDNPASLARFYREARLAAALRHPHVAGQHEIESDGGTHVLVTPFVDGVSLERIVRKRGPLDAVRAAHYIRQAALGLQHIHEAGLVHRDVRPENLLLDRQGTVRLVNVGLGPFLREHRAALPRYRLAARSQASAPAYLAPEQTRPGRLVDGRADVCGLGATFCYLLTGKPPGDDLGELRSRMPEELAALIDHMRARDPALRPQPAEVVEMLASWTATPISPPPAEEMPLLSLAALKPVPPAPEPAAVAEAAEEEPKPPAQRPSADSISRWAAAIPTAEETAAGANLPEPPPPGELAEADAVAEEAGALAEDSAVEFLLDAEEKETAVVPSRLRERDQLTPAVETQPNGPLPRKASPPSPVKPSRNQRSVAVIPKRQGLLVVVLALVAVVPALGGLAFLGWHLLREESPTSPPPVEGPPLAKVRLFEGAVEAVHANGVQGWAWDSKNPDDLIHVDIYDGAKRLATVSADIYRQDLHSTRQMGHGKHAFGYRFPDELKDGQEHWIHVRFAGTEIELTGSPKRVLLKAGP